MTSDALTHRALDISRLWDGVALWVALCWYDDRAYEYEENQARIRRRTLQIAQYWDAVALWVALEWYEGACQEEGGSCRWLLARGSDR